MEYDKLSISQNDQQFLAGAFASARLFEEKDIDLSVPWKPVALWMA